MKKQKIALGFRVKHLFTRYVWLKIISLALAIMIWLYVQGKLRL